LLVHWTRRHPRRILDFLFLSRGKSINKAIHRCAFKLARRACAASPCVGCFTAARITQRLCLGQRSLGDELDYLKQHLLAAKASGRRV